MTITEGMEKYRLPNPTCKEDLEVNWSKVLDFGDRVILAGYHYNGNRPGWYGAVYEYLTDDTTCEGAIGLRAVSDLVFLDDGHAMAWALQNAQ